MKKQEKHDKTKRVISATQSFKIITITVIPIIVSQTVYQLNGIVDVTLFNGVMGMKGVSDKVVSTMQGIYSTKYRLLVNVPVAVSTAIPYSMIPSLVTSFASGETDSVKDKVSMAVKFNMIIAFPYAMGLSVLHSFTCSRQRNISCACMYTEWQAIGKVPGIYTGSYKDFLCAAYSFIYNGDCNICSILPALYACN